MRDARRPAVFAAGVALLLALPLAHAQQAVVRSYDAPELEVGQAWLMHSGGRCFAVLPFHVAQETSVPSLLREGPRGLRGEGVEVVDLGDDAAVAVLAGGIGQDCGYSVGSIPRSVERRLRDGGLGTLRSVNGDGTLGRLAVTVVDDDGAGLLRVLPTVEGERIRKGHSGSLLLLGDQPVGMLLSVSARSGVGTVIRTDALMAKVDAFVRGGVAAPAPAVASSPAQGPAAAGAIAPASGAWQVTGWSVDPTGSGHIAARLTSGGSEGFWAARVPQWPAAVELGGPDAVRIVRGVEFIAGEAGDSPALPARVQVMTSVNAERPAWRAVTSGTLEYVDGVARLEFLPVRARLLRLEIYATRGAPAEVALGRVRILEGER
ncbi:hypothetical protein [Thioalkalivibrio sp. XN8]|uniref:hypothetical protein n=1 Tax=Thioalkalivibrio sp. XN8 TaxID=2712863 RepID=UPI0013EBC6F7|nr:hypothetical protein [Thioalkalivibrio sp. XN8]NGP53773.1 hypothetical protein [Thioalkalivibrio sp. XN8]